MTTEIKDGFLYVLRTGKGVYCPAGRSGNCHDFAVLMIDAAHSAGFAVRFVTGYIFVPDHDTTQGGGAAQAWLQIFLPGAAGWISIRLTASSGTGTWSG
ncbi:transglutaminase-like domain-containing protein [Paraburkholderia sp. RAU2J]|uniref:transglutaminase-like domain-containing protein n=1 Tax=Paraburkholderia sp. RAU2J TaxID=1938810 RepID=UPI001F54683D|nr:transglutaminase-like domain-containing protein [Paraburkholderia sp. RAU2J]